MSWRLRLLYWNSDNFSWYSHHPYHLTKLLQNKQNPYHSSIVVVIFKESHCDTKRDGVQLIEAVSGTPKTWASPPQRSLHPTTQPVSSWVNGPFTELPVRCDQASPESDIKPIHRRHNGGAEKHGLLIQHARYQAVLEIGAGKHVVTLSLAVPFIMGEECDVHFDYWELGLSGVSGSCSLFKRGTFFSFFFVYYGERNMAWINALKGLLGTSRWIRLACLIYAWQNGHSWKRIPIIINFSIVYRKSLRKKNEYSVSKTIR